MLKNDEWIKEKANQGMISPFEPQQVRKLDNDLPVISYGLSGFGYDIRLSPNEFRIFRHIPGTIVDPKNFNPDNLEQTQLCTDETGSYFILPAHSYGLGVALERLDIPDNVTVICVGKSTYARCGLIANITPAEACMADDTEVLAKTGWKLLKDVVIGEEILTLNPETNQAEYQPLQDKQSYYYNGDLLHFSSKSIDQLVTPEHRMWTAKKKRRVEVGGKGWETKQKGVQRQPKDYFQFGFEKAGDIFGKWNYYVNRKVNWEGVNTLGDWVYCGKYCFRVEDYVKFIGCWLGDGSAYVAQGGDYIIKLAVVTKQGKRNYFRNLLERMGVKYHETQYGFSFQNKQLCQYLLPLAGAKTKYIPTKLKQLPPSLLEHLIEGMLHSDGNLETQTYGSSSYQLISDFQEICLKAGYHCTQWEKTDWSPLTETVSTQYKARVCKSRVTPNKLLPKNMRKVPYSGMVYDVTVPNHVFLSRRNGRASWTGNSWRGNLTLEFSNASSADCKLYANEGIVQLMFLEGESCSVSYDKRKGKYQEQPDRVTLPRV